MVMFFYIFSLLLVLSSIMTITSRNPVHAVLWLIFCFCNVSGLFVLIGAEFIAMMLIIIYVGAVAVLFLFVVMMLDINFSELKGKIGEEVYVSFLLAAVLFIDLATISCFAATEINPNEISKFTINNEVLNVTAIGRHIYTNFVLPFQTAGVILFVAMIASITLTLRLRKGTKKQDVSEQLKRNKDSCLAVAQKDGKIGLDGLDYGD